MAATRGRVTGGNRNSETGTASRLGSEYVTAHADTFETFATVTTRKDGRVFFEVRDEGGTLVSVELSAQTDERRRATVSTFDRVQLVDEIR